MVSSPADPPATSCAKCAAPFVCGASAGLASCWCMQQPQLACAPVPGTGCYCPACLEQRSSDRQCATAPAT
ncbi:cysteine-rich CWC family protein [Accumulibacter sp.]|uniref:cysteine-rich CWC family protein n=1 Tax=Accumulibacter sp. TaxID=2053492 RepID=UPI002B71B81C|nr:cysteine-rich CWC family protein [Accumulibacter sp.]HPU79901.1 cysteine-rich CWC family protein [Accumulibacter sp.]